MFHVVMAGYPSDLTDEGIEPALDRMQGHLGIADLALWAACPAGLILRPRQVQPWIRRFNGGLCFEPDPGCYQGTRIKPRRGSTKPRRTFEAVSDACRNRSIRVRAIISASRTGTLPQINAAYACRNILGEPSRRSLCLGSDEVSQFITAMVSDISRRDGVEAIELTDLVCRSAEPWSSALARDPRLGSLERMLMSACFCESCIRRAESAGIDPDEARADTRRILETVFDSGPASIPSLGEFLDMDRPARAYVALRRDVLARLTTDLARASDCPIILHPGQDPDAIDQQRAVDPSMPAATVVRDDDAIETDPTGADGSGSKTDADATPHTTGDGATAGGDATGGGGATAGGDATGGTPESGRMSGGVGIGSAGARGAPRLLRLDAGRDHNVFADPRRLVALLPRLPERGFAGIEIHTFSELPNPAHDALRQALRYVRRETGD